MRDICCILALATVLLGALTASGDQARSNDRDRDALVALENEWLKNEHNASELEHILAADFLHPVVTGDLLNKEQHIEFSTTHPALPDVARHFEGL